MTKWICIIEIHLPQDTKNTDKGMMNIARVYDIKIPQK